MQGGYKVCPRCQTPAALDAPVCANCGHVYRTQFQQPNQTTGFLPPGPPGMAPGPYSNYPRQHYYNPNAIQMPPGMHNVPMAIFLSLCCINGVAQAYNKQTMKGVALFLGSLLVGAATSGLGFLVIGIVCAIDGIRIARRLNRGEQVGMWQFF